MYTLFWTLFVFSATVNAFQIQVYVPSLVEIGRPVILACYTNLGRSRIYKVNWFKNGSKFYRYKVNTHDEPKKVFQVSGIQLDPIGSNLTHVSLHSVNVFSEGEYTCEVETTGPAFRSNSNSSELKVFSLPEQNMRIEKDVNDWHVNLTCISNPTYPETKLTWWINDQKPKDEFLTFYPTQIRADGTKISMLGLKLKSRALRGATTFKCKGVVAVDFKTKRQSIGEFTSLLTVHIANPGEYAYEKLDYIDNSGYSERYNRDKMSLMEENGNYYRRRKSYNSSNSFTATLWVSLIVLINLAYIKL